VVTSYVNSKKNPKKLYLLSDVWSYNKGVESRQQQQQQRGNTMFVKFNKDEKKIIGKLVKAGNDLYCNGQGWHFNDICFASFKDFWKFCESKV
jgi:hypothetical protein